MQSYNAARSTLGFLEFICWVAVVGGVILLFVGAAAGASSGFLSSGSSVHAFMGGLPGAMLTIIGFIGVVLVQVGRASVDTAENTGQLLIASREELKLMKAQLANQPVPSNIQGKQIPAKQPPAGLGANGDAAPVEKPKPVIPSVVKVGVLEFKGKFITRTDAGVHYGNQTYRSIEELYDILRVDRKHIPGSFAVPLPIKPPKPKEHAYLGRTIEIIDDGHRVDGQTFKTLEEAKMFIDNSTLRATR